jgi:hypothetical protein
MTRTLVVRFGKTREKALYREAAMREFFRDSIVANYESHVPQMQNHPKDRHVLAAVACRADYVVTFNLKHFLPRSASAHGVTVIGPSAFLQQLAGLDRGLVEERLRQQAAAIGIRICDLLDRLKGSVPGFVSMLREF